MNNPIEGLEDLPEEQKNALMTQIEETQVRDRYAPAVLAGNATGKCKQFLCVCSLRMYNNVVERCFRDCVESFRRKDLDNNEERVSLQPSRTGCSCVAVVSW